MYLFSNPTFLILALKKFATARIFLLSVDCSASESEVNAAFATAIEKFGPPYTLVNCAGTSIAGIIRFFHIFNHFILTFLY